MLCRAGLVAVGLAGAALIVPGTAGAVLPNPPCGTILYNSVTLHSNMDCSGYAGDGLIVGKSGITINLNGFALIGPDNGDYYGIDNESQGGYNNVTVRNGSIYGWDEGIYFDATNGTKIVDVQAGEAPGVNGGRVGGEPNYTGIDLEDSTNGTVTDSTADYNYDDGIYLENNHMVTVSDTDASYNSYEGIYDENSLDTIDGDTTNYNGGCARQDAAVCARVKTNLVTAYNGGIHVYHPLTAGGLYYTIEHSSADYNAFNGVSIEDNTPTTLSQADVFSNTAQFNGQSGDGFGFLAYQQVKGFGNGASGNASGNCRHVKCHNLTP